MAADPRMELGRKWVVDNEREKKKKNCAKLGSNKE
jgi:hypothetical protein